MATTYPTVPQLSAYIVDAAKKRNIDPNIALSVARGEGLYANPAEGWQSKVVKNGVREPSYGPFQLYTNGGLGDRFIKDTGLDPRDPANVYKTIDYALDVASKEGWDAWMGAKKQNITGMMGINSAAKFEAPSSVPDPVRPEEPKVVYAGSDNVQSFDHYAKTGVDTSPNAAVAGKPQIKVYGHVNWQNVDPQVKDMMALASARLNEPFNITSGYRSLTHPVEARKGPGALHRHTSGKAVDLDVTGWSDERKAKTIEMLAAMGATGLGIYPSGKMIHVDWSGLGKSYKGKGTASTWFGTEGGSGPAPAWFTDAVNRGLTAQKEGKLPDSITLGFKPDAGAPASIPGNGPMADLSYGQSEPPQYETDQEAYARAQNDNSIMGFGPDGVSYADTWKTAYERGWFIPNLNAAMNTAKFQYDPNFDLDKALKERTEGVSPDYYYQYASAGSQAQFDQITDQIKLQMKQDQIMAANPWMGTLATIVAEVTDPVTLGASVATEGALAPYLYGLKLGRVGKVAWGALSAGAGNLAAEATLDAVDQRRHTAWDYGIAFGAGVGLGGLMGLRRGGSEVDDAINSELSQIGKTIVKDGIAARDNSVGAAVNPNAPSRANEVLLDNTAAHDFGDTPEMAKAGIGRKIGNALANPISDPVTKAEKIGAEAFNITRQIIPDPRGARAGEVVEKTVVDDFMEMYQANMVEWETTVFPQYDKWAAKNLKGWDKAKKRLGLDDEGRHTFFNKVADYVEETDPIKRQAYDPEVQVAGNAATRINNLIREEAVRLKIEGMPTVQRPNYMPLYRDDNAVKGIVEKFSYNDLQDMLKTQFKRMIPDIEGDLLEKLSEGYLKNILRASLSMEDPIARAFALADREQLMAFMKQELGITDPQLVDQFMALTGVRKAVDGGEATPRVKARAFDMEGYATKVFLKYSDDYTGPRNAKGGEEVSIRDFFHKDAHVQMTRYMKEMSGTLAFAKMQIKNPKTGEIILDGVRNDSDWAKVKEFISGPTLAKDMSKADKVKDLLAELDHIRNEIAKGGAGNPRMSAIGRRLMVGTFIHFMQNMGINQAQEFTNIISGMGIRAAIRSMPAYRRMLNQAGKSVPIDPVMRDLQSLLGRGYEVLLGSRKYHVSENALGNEAIGSKLAQGLDYTLTKGQALVSKLSGMEYIDNYLQNWAIRAGAQYFADLAAKYGKAIDAGRFKMTDIDGLFTKADSKRLRALGLDDARLIKVMNSFRQHAGITDSATRLKELNLEKWDPETLAVFRTAINRWASRAIQKNEIGTLSRYLSHPVAKIMLQFRSFVFGAYNKQTMYGLNHFDGRTAMTWILQTMAGAATWYLYQKGLSLGEKNPDQYMEKRFGKEGTWDFYKNLGTAGFNRAGYASLLPMVYDTAAYMTGLPRIDARASQQASAIWGSPVVSLFDMAANSSKNFINSVQEGREQSRQEIKNNVRTLFGNWLPVMVFTGLLSQDRPERPPRTN